MARGKATGGEGREGGGRGGLHGISTSHGTTFMMHLWSVFDSVHTAA